MAVQGLREQGSREQVRWPAYTMAVLFLGYALGKAVRAAQGRLGFPGGPEPSASEHEWYAANVMEVATSQWWALVTGLAAVALHGLVEEAPYELQRYPDAGHYCLEFGRSPWCLSRTRQHVLGELHIEYRDDWPA